MCDNWSLLPGKHRILAAHLHFRCKRYNLLGNQTKWISKFYNVMPLSIVAEIAFAHFSSHSKMFLYPAKRKAWDVQVSTEKWIMNWKNLVRMFSCGPLHNYRGQAQLQNGYSWASTLLVGIMCHLCKTNPVFRSSFIKLLTDLEPVVSVSCWCTVSVIVCMFTPQLLMSVLIFSREYSLIVPVPGCRHHIEWSHIQFLSVLQKKDSMSGAQCHSKPYSSKTTAHTVL